MNSYLRHHLTPSTPMPVAEIYAFTASVSHAMNVAKAAIDTRDEAKLVALKIEFGNALLELHAKQLGVTQSYQAILDENESIKKKLATHERWEQECERYHLHQLEPGVFVYALKSDRALGEPPHWLCAACHNEREKSILQKVTAEMFTCHRNQLHHIYVGRNEPRLISVPL